MREVALNSPELVPFDNAVLPHLRAAYDLARWLTRNDQDAEDVVQEASLRALKYWAAFAHRDSRSWLLTIVRNTFYTWARERSLELRPRLEVDPDEFDSGVPSPESATLQLSENEMLNTALENLPSEFREAFVLREIEGLSYKEIADIANVPIGTVMSRLARGRKRLQADLMHLRM